MQMEGKLYKIRNNATEYLGCSVSTSEEIPLTQKSHYHDYYQIYYVRRGSLIHTVDGKYIKVMQGDSFIVPPFVTHKIAIDDASARFVSFSFFEGVSPVFFFQVQAAISSRSRTGSTSAKSLRPSASTTMGV